MQDTLSFSPLFSLKNLDTEYITEDMLILLGFQSLRMKDSCDSPLPGRALDWGYYAHYNTLVCIPEDKKPLPEVDQKPVGRYAPSPNVGHIRGPLLMDFFKAFHVFGSYNKKTFKDLEKIKNPVFGIKALLFLKEEYTYSSWVSPDKKQSGTIQCLDLFGVRHVLRYADDVLVSHESSVQDKNTGKWQPCESMYYHYDMNRLVRVEENSFFKKEKREYTFDSNGNVAVISYWGEDTTGAPLDRIRYTYVNGMCSRKTSKTLGLESWDSYSFSDDSRLISYNNMEINLHV